MMRWQGRIDFVLLLALVCLLAPPLLGDSFAELSQQWTRLESSMTMTRIQGRHHERHSGYRVSWNPARQMELVEATGAPHPAAVSDRFMWSLLVGGSHLFAVRTARTHWKCAGNICQIAAGKDAMDIFSLDLVSSVLGFQRIEKRSSFALTGSLNLLNGLPDVLEYVVTDEDFFNPKARFVRRTVRVEFERVKDFDTVAPRFCRIETDHPGTFGMRHFVNEYEFSDYRLRRDWLEPVQSLEQRYLTALNRARQARGLSTLAWSSKLAQAARRRAIEQAEAGRVDHGDGQNYLRAIRATGYAPRYAGECVAGAWNQTPEQIVTGWLNSPAHARQLLESRVVETGIGRVAWQGGEMIVALVAR